MAKDTFYFSHDYNARSDEKIKRLIRKHGLKGYGVFWAIVEDLYNNANALRRDYDGIAFELHEDPVLIESVISDFDLFVFENGSFGSLSIESRLEERNQKSKSASKSANLRWEKYRQEREENANALQTQCEGNAIKERKGKEIKEIDGFVAKATSLEIKKNEFIELLKPFSQKNGGQFPEKMMNAFYNYWTEKNQSGTKMKFQLQKTFEVSKRLVTWANNESKFAK